MKQTLSIIAWTLAAYFGGSILITLALRFALPPMVEQGFDLKEHTGKIQLLMSAFPFLSALLFMVLSFRGKLPGTR